MNVLFETKSDSCPQTKADQTALPASNHHVADAAFSSKLSDRMSKVQSLCRDGAEALGERWRNLDKKKLAQNIAYSLVLKVLVAQVPVPEELLRPLNPFDT